MREYHLEKHVLLPGFRTDVLGCIKGFDLFAMSSVTEGLGTSLLDAMACAQGRSWRPRAGGIPEVVEDGVTGVLVRRAITARWRARSSRLLTDDRCGADGRRPGWRASATRFTVERMVAATAAVYAARGRQTPRSGHCASFCARLNPHAFIIPRWQSEKSYLTGSSGSSAAQRRRDVARHRASPGSCSASAARQRPTRITWVSSGTTSADGGTRDHTPRSSASRRTIQRRNRFNRLQPLPADGRGKK